MRRALGGSLVAAALVLASVGATRATAAPTDGERFALVVGISKYSGRTKPTVGGAGDAAAVREALRRAGWRDDHVKVLVDRDATAANIRAGFRWLRENSTDSSFSVFHYSGHVRQSGRDRDRDGEVVDEFLMPYDARRVISDREVSEQLRGVRGWLWVNISGCEAAGFDEGLSGPRRLFTGSSAETEKSYERPDWRMSVFTGLLVSQGMLERRADADGSGKVSVQEAFAYAAKAAPAMTARQKPGPQHPHMAGGDGRQWYLERMPPPAPPHPRPAPRRACVGPICI